MGILPFQMIHYISFHMFEVHSFNALFYKGQHKAIDVMVIFILHSIVSLKKKIEVLIRKKIIEGQLTRKLLEDTILVHGLSLRE